MIVLLCASGSLEALLYNHLRSKPASSFRKIVNKVRVMRRELHYISRHMLPDLSSSRPARQMERLYLDLRKEGMRIGSGH